MNYKMVQFNKNFKHDLEFGEINEKKLAEILLKEKIEVKTERGIWDETGNIAIEIECRGKKSGLSTTEAAYWVHILEKDGKQCVMLMFEVAHLKKVVDKMYAKKEARMTMGGDGNLSKMVLIPLDSLFDFVSNED